MNRSSLVSSCVLALAAVLPVSASAGQEPEKPDCDTMAICLQQLRQASGNKRGIGPDDEALVERLLSFGPDIVPALVGVLADPNERAADLAGYALRQTPHIDRRFLPQIEAGLDRGLGWLAPALCRMDGEDVAREAVARFIVSKSAPQNQEGYALKLCGRRAIPYIVEAARCGGSCGPHVHLNLADILADMEEARAEAAPGLLAIARDTGVANDAAVGALRMIGALGADARQLEPELLRLRTRRPALATAVDDALVAIGAQQADQIFIERLTADPNLPTLRDLAAAGPAGVRAGPAVVKLLDSEDWRIRLAAARTLGFIGDAEAVEPLIRRLDDPTDVRLNGVAAESLGRLQSQAAVPALRAVAQTHWYPPVRRAAATAIEHIEQHRAYERRFRHSGFGFEFLAFEYLGSDLTSCSKPLPKEKPEPRREKLHASRAPEELEKLAYETIEIRYVPAQPEAVGDDGSGGEKKGDDRSEASELTSGNLVEQRTPTRQVPNVALRVDGGWLAGADRGEWGGELVFIADDGATQLLLDDNVENIYRLGDRIVALTGLAHLSMNRGMVQAVSRDASGSWSARPWRALPGAPMRSWRVQSGELLIDLSSGGTVLLHPDGSFRMAPCAAGR